MPWTNPPTFAANTVLKAPTMNDSVRDNLHSLGHLRPAARLSLSSSGQNLFNATPTTIQFTNVDWASTGSVAQFGLAPLPSNTDRITATQAGFYFVSGTVEFSSNATNSRSVSGFMTRAIGGTNELGLFTDRAVSGSTHTINFQFMTWDVQVGDYFYIQAFQNSGSTLTVGLETNLSVVLLKAIP
jgi:hypothetical protein